METRWRMRLCRIPEILSWKTLTWNPSCWQGQWYLDQYFLSLKLVFLNCPSKKDDYAVRRLKCEDIKLHLFFTVECEIKENNLVAGDRSAFLLILGDLTQRYKQNKLIQRISCLPVGFSRCPITKAVSQLKAQLMVVKETVWSWSCPPEWLVLSLKWLMLANLLSLICCYHQTGNTAILSELAGYVLC